jgi:hypothetical protein
LIPKKIKLSGESMAVVVPSYGFVKGDAVESCTEDASIVPK